MGLAVQGDEEAGGAGQEVFEADPLVQFSPLVMEAVVAVDVGAYGAEGGKPAVVEVMDDAGPGAEASVGAVCIDLIIPVQDSLVFTEPVQEGGRFGVQVDGEARGQMRPIAEVRTAAERENGPGLRRPCGGPFDGAPVDAASRIEFIEEPGRGIGERFGRKALRRRRVPIAEGQIGGRMNNG